MDYEKMTKAELIAELNTKTHLASAVQAKDIEMSTLKRDHQKVIQEYKNTIHDFQVKQEETIIARVGELKQEIESKHKPLKDKVETLTTTVKVREAQLIKVIGSYESIVKIIQGTSDVHSDVFTNLNKEIRGE